MDFIEEMKNSGVDTDNALERFIGNTAFLEKMLKKTSSLAFQNPWFDSFTQTFDFRHLELLWIIKSLD